MYSRIITLSKKKNRIALSVVELKIIELMADGYSTKEIGVMLKRTVSSIETYRYRVLSKLEVKNGFEGIAFCLRNGIIK